LHGDWHDQLEREGLDHLPDRIQLDTAGEEPPCPACGTAAPLVDGACSDCGLQLDR
jgi:hypothetical protein